MQRKLFRKLSSKVLLPTCGLTLAGLTFSACGGGDGSATVFEILIENVTNQQTLTASNGAAVPVVFSPALGVVHDNGTTPVYVTGQPATVELETAAEDAELGTLTQSLSFTEGVRLVGVVSTPRDSDSQSSLLPGNTYRLLVSADTGRASLSLFTVFLQGNDLFVATPPAGVPLFDEAGNPRTGDITGQLGLYDAGTEVNQEPGLGGDQIPRQAGPNTGAAEGGVVRLVDDGFNYPSVGGMMRVTVNVVGEFEN